MQKSNEIIYQIFPRNHSLEGNFTGIIYDLPRIKELGVDIIYLMPINEIGKKNRKGRWGSPYASRDYFSISSDLGTLNDFQRLCEETHKLGMKIILDMVFNHTAPDNVLLTEHPEFYFYRNGKLGNRVGDWSDIVDLNVDRIDTQDYLISVLKYWIKQGVDGFRFDVATMIPIYFFVRAREEVGKQVIFLAESIDTSFFNWLVSQGYYVTKDEDMVPIFDSLYNYHWFRQFEGYLKYGDSLKPVAEILNTPSKVLRINCLENHDNERIANLLNKDETRLKNALAFIFFLSGCPFIYAGQEYGATHKPELFEKDPINWKDRNEDIYHFTKLLIDLKHKDYNKEINSIKVSLFDKDGLKIEKGNLIGLFNFGKKPLSLNIGNDKYVNLLGNNIVNGQNISLSEPLILKRMKIDYCFHTHTYRCGHAYGEDISFVLEAIAEDIVELGFSDHVFLPGKIQPGIRGNFELLEEYINSINSLKKQFTDDINIHLGFECEYFPEYVEYYRDLKTKYGIEYLILGQHCFYDESGFHWYLYDNCPYERIKRYTDDLIKGMETGLFAYVAHPDIFVTPYPTFNSGCEECARRICQAAEKLRVPLEMNLGMNVLYSNPTNLSYPNEDFWRIASEYDIEVYIGVDAHRPEAFHTVNYNRGISLIEKYHLKLLTRLKK